MPVTLHDNFLTFRYKYEKPELKGDFLKMITIYNYNVHLARLTDKKDLFEVANEMYFGGKASSKKRQKSIQSPGIMVSASRVSLSTRFSFAILMNFVIE